MSKRIMTRSEAILSRAQELIPGGVSSPVRAFQAVGGSPAVIERGAGAHIWDVDGNKYLDFVCSWGPLILGHANAKVTEAIVKAAQNGTTFGAPCEAELGLAERVTRLYPAIDQVRFVSSGTEATMSAIRVARGCTSRDYLVKFAGCYHGHADHLLVEAGSGLVTFGQPASAGVPAAFAEKTLVLPLDDIDALEALFGERGHEIAAVIVEPLPANNGLLKQTPEFIAALRRITKEHGTLLIYDEVINGFRLAPGGAAELYKVEPDLATFGKVIGGGLPVGAFGGKAGIIRRLDTQGVQEALAEVIGDVEFVRIDAVAVRLDQLDVADGRHATALLVVFDALGHHPIAIVIDLHAAGRGHPLDVLIVDEFIGTQQHPGVIGNGRRQGRGRYLCVSWSGIHTIHAHGRACQQDRKAPSDISAVVYRH